MAANLTQVYEFAVVPGSPMRQLVREHHYLRLKGETAESPLYVQAGQIHSENGPALSPDEIPSWVWTELEKCSPEALAAVGWPEQAGATRRR